MKLIVGLGNPGKEYENTRHNVGFMLVERLVEDEGLDWSYDKKFDSEITKTTTLVYAKPQTFMNKSGRSVSALVNYFNINLADLMVVHDDVDMEFGKVRVKRGMGPGGHHGVIDIIEKVGSSDFWRMKVGIGRPEHNKFDVEDWVLNKLTEDELKLLGELNLREALKDFLMQANNK